MPSGVLRSAAHTLQQIDKLASREEIRRGLTLSLIS